MRKRGCEKSWSFQYPIAQAFFCGYYVALQTRGCEKTWNSQYPIAQAFWLQILRCIAETWMRENCELSISDNASVFSADLTVHCRNVDARKL